MIDEIPLGRRSSRIDRLRIKHFRLLDEVARSGTLTAASGTLDISQPSATKLLQEMENSLRARLVDRTTRGGVLTVAGERVLERARVLIHAAKALEEQLDSLHEQPLIRIGFVRLAGITIFPRLVQQLARDGSMPRIQLQEGAVSELLDKLTTGALDCVIGRLQTRGDQGQADQFDISVLHADPYAIACAPSSPFSRKRNVSLANLANQRWIVAPAGTDTRRTFESIFLGLGIQPPRPVIESPSFHDNFAILSESPFFLTIAPKTTVDYYMMLGKVRAVRLKESFPENRVILAIRREMLEIPAIKKIKQALLDQFGNEPRGNEQVRLEQVNLGVSGAR